MNNFNYFSVTSVAVFLGQLVNPERASLKSIPKLVFLGVVLKRRLPGVYECHMDCLLTHFLRLADHLFRFAQTE